MPCPSDSQGCSSDHRRGPTSANAGMPCMHATCALQHAATPRPGARLPWLLACTTCGAHLLRCERCGAACAAEVPLGVHVQVGHGGTLPGVHRRLAWRQSETLPESVGQAPPGEDRPRVRLCAGAHTQIESMEWISGVSFAVGLPSNAHSGA